MNKDLKEDVQSALEELDEFIAQASGEVIFEYGQRQDPALRRTFEFIKYVIEDLVDLVESNATQPKDTIP